MIRGPRTTRHKNVTRIDHPIKRTHGYTVRIAWKGAKHGKFFSDRVHGDRLGALAAAIEWRDRTERQIGKPRTEHQVVGWHSRNNTGVVGVRRRKRGNIEVFEATWISRGEKRKRITTCFSIARHGEKKAFKLALRARQNGERMRWSCPRVRRDPQKPTENLVPFPWVPPAS
ncbi:MAG: AP2/ERF family transcription factor [Roseiflexaceae bacterium]|nr:AP2/ERF family transcription factor [Roseiflexaceae bacterium]